MSFISPDQLKSVAESVLSRISGLVSSDDLKPIKTVVRGVISLDDLNSDSFAVAKNYGVYIVESSSIKQGLAVVFMMDLATTCVLCIGSFVLLDNGSLGYHSRANSKIPRVSIALRYNSLMPFLSPDGLQQGVSPWITCDIANLATMSFLTGSAAGSSETSESCSCKFWKGSQDEYDALSEIDPDTVYLVTE